MPFDLISKLISEGKKPRLIMVFGDEQNFIKEDIKQVLRKYFQTGEEFLVFEADPKEKEKIVFFMKNTGQPILIINKTADYYDDIKEIIKLIPKEGFAILNFEEESIQKLRDGLSELSEQFLTFGFNDKSDFRASDVKINGDINFKLNYKENTVPIWLRGSFDQGKRISAALATLTAGTVLNLNLIEISQILKEINGTEVEKS